MMPSLPDRMTAIEKLTLSRLEDRIVLLEAAVCAVSEACAQLLARVEALEREKR